MRLVYTPTAHKISYNFILKEHEMRQVSVKLADWLDAYNALAKQLEETGFKATPTNTREGLAGITWSGVTRKTPVEWVQDDLVEGKEFDVPVRIYHSAPERQLPVLVYFHGGGHMAGGITVYDPICRRLARETEHIVISVDYRLAPECRYPAGITDAVTVVKNLWKVLETRQLRHSRSLSIGGDSAGGAIAATVAHHCRHDKEVEIRRQILIYPSLDYTMHSASIELNGEGYLLQQEKIAWFFDNYFEEGVDRQQASPLYMELDGRMPGSLVITAEFCPLRDEGLAYFEKLQAGGLRAKNLHFEDMIHVFLNLEDLVKEECDTLYAAIAAFLK
jgi:acetyl esterase/lipase